MVDDLPSPQLLEIEDDGVYIHEDAPDDFVEWYDNNTELGDALVEFALTATASDYPADGMDPVKWQRYADREKEAMERAVDDGDIEAAQKHKRLSESFENAGKRYRDALLEG